MKCQSGSTDGSNHGGKFEEVGTLLLAVELLGTMQVVT